MSNPLAAAQFNALKTKNLSQTDSGDSIGSGLNLAPYSPGVQSHHSMAYMEGNRRSSDWAKPIWSSWDRVSSIPWRT